MCKGVLRTVCTNEHSRAYPCAPPDESSCALYVMYYTHPLHHVISR